MMAIEFSVDEIFEMAEQIERNASKFYLEAARRADNEKMQKMFIDLASMEDGHMKTFHEMREGLEPEDRELTSFDPDNEAIQYLQAMADAHGTEGKKNRAEKLTGNESIRDILKTAVNAEKDSIVFYTALKDLVDARTGKDKVEAIIDEELGHLAILNQHLSGLS